MPKKPHKRVKCAVFGCEDRSSMRHRFPRNEEELLKKWIIACGNPYISGLTKQKFPRLNICDRHFHEDSKCADLRRGLKRNAVPTLFLPDRVVFEDDSYQIGESSKSQEVENLSQDERLCKLPYKQKFDDALGGKDAHVSFVLPLKVTESNAALSDPPHPQQPDPLHLQDHSPVADTYEDSNEFDTFVDSATFDHDYFLSTVPGKMQVSGYVNTQHFCKNNQEDFLSKHHTLEKLRRELCRLCGQRGSVLKPLFETTSDKCKDVSTLSKIGMYLPIKVKLEDSLPFCICSNCLLVLNQWHELYTTCVAADAVLSKTFGIEYHPTTNNNSCTSKVCQNAQTQTEEITSSAVTEKIPSGGLRTEILTVGKPSHSVICETRENEDICTNCGESKSGILQENKIFKKEFDKIFRMNLNTSYKCRFCHELFRNSVDRKSHIAICHQLPTVCELCGHEVPCRKDLMKHKYQKHNGHNPAPRKYLCDKCDRFCTSASGLKFHLENIHGTEDLSRKYCCELCCALFTRKIYYHIHKRKHEMGKLKPIFQMESFRQVVISEGSENYVYACPVCQEKFNDKSSLAVHLTDKKKLKCSLCHSVVYSEKSLFLHVCGQWTCQYCSKSFDKRIKWLLHERWHTGEKPLKCRKCNQMFRSWQSRRFHEKNHDALCTYCGKSFTNKYVFQDHVSRHEGKDFSCHICNKKFSGQKNLDKHLTKFHNDNPKDVYINE